MSASVPIAKSAETTPPTDEHDIYEVTVRNGQEELRILIPGEQARFFAGESDPWRAALWLAYADRWSSAQAE